MMIFPALKKRRDYSLPSLKVLVFSIGRISVDDDDKTIELKT